MSFTFADGAATATSTSLNLPAVLHVTVDDRHPGRLTGLQAPDCLTLTARSGDSFDPAETSPSPTVTTDDQRRV